MRIGATYFGREPHLLERILPLVDFIETTPDSIAEIRAGQAVISEDVLAELREIATAKKLLVHGIGLSIGSFDQYSEEYLALLDQIIATVPVAWHSEHLAWTMVDGVGTGTMFALPRLNLVAEMLSERVAAIQHRYTIPFLVENVVNLLPDHPENEMSPAGFLNAIVRRTGCGLLLDVYNLECDARNGKLDLASFFDELDFRAVREIHIANGTEVEGMLVDVHSRRTRRVTLEIADEIVRRASNAEVMIFELLPQAIPAVGHDAIVEELTMLRERYA